MATAEVPVEVAVNATVTPDGRPEPVKTTAPEKPSRSVTVMVSVPLLPCSALTVLEEALMAKFGMGRIPYTITEAVPGT